MLQDLQSHKLAGLLGYAVTLVAILLVLDRLKLRAEARGRINYRRNGLSRTGPLYHALKLQSIFDPGIRHASEIRYEEKKTADAAGDPLKRPSEGEEDSSPFPGSTPASLRCLRTP